MVQRVSLWDAGCPVARALDVIGDWWSLLIIATPSMACGASASFRRTGIAKGMLSTRLRDLTERGILETAPASDGSAYKEYVLTKKGRGLFLVIVALRQWGEFISIARMNQILAGRHRTGASVARLELRRAGWATSGLERYPSEEAEDR